MPVQEVSATRQQALQQIQNQHFDVLVIGGGITGLGVAVDAATRGLKVALVEREDFASGTSSKSSKLIHGGVRYLQQGEIALVYEALHERQRLKRNAPHLVQTLPFMIPILKRDGVVSRKIARALGTALWMYDLTGGWRIGKFHRRLNADKAFTHLPTMDRKRLGSAYLYFDAMADDARVCIALARTAASHGAAVLNYAPVEKILHDQQGRACGAIVKPRDANSITINARVIVNAAGVWSDEVMTTDEGKNPESIRPAKGVHLTVPWKMVRNDIAVVIPVPGDKRSLFLVPWISNYDGTYQYTYIGTTDTDYQGSIDDPQCTRVDIDYVLRALNAAVTTNVTADDVTAVWSGLRPLVKSVSGEKLSSRTADLSRRHKVSKSNSGVITIAGGKLTTYRKMAQDTVDEVVKTLGVSAKCKTKSLKFIGAKNNSTKLADKNLRHLQSRFGGESEMLAEMITQDPNLGEPLIAGLPYLRAEAVFAVQYEMARTLDDILSRRTRARIINRRASVASARGVAELIAPYLGWGEQEINNQVLGYCNSCADEDHAALQLQ
ncbi:MAG: glycerol-3-phosphate dehydrogenase/oxidase [Actinobacteria bacterium]|nr:glycerol-3-phosphate dehydrogenase/oxidase [Actinomycetota bacterium]NDA96729.1 glycerol-3-phosphate dehydrogenase/oxidase [Actinomycetota bacterium]NDC99544.1 glycerol-3-phosphate dehydrogenase/oxidase [bacterium]NDF66572.1 glycerol-3-phosphate dehydrogenase/oxidase [Actinomycetota bacterium]